MQKILDFFKEISEDEAAKQKLQSVSQKLGTVNSEEDAKKIITSELVPLAKSKGYNITAGEFIEFLKNANTELTDDALAMASGGRSTLGEKIGNALMFIGAGTSLFAGMTFGLGGSSGNTAKQNNRPAYVQTVDNNRDMLKSTMQSNSDAGTGKAATETQAQNKAQTKNNARTLQQRTSDKARSKSVSARNVPFSQKVGRNFGKRVNAKALDEATKNKEAVANFKEIIDNEQSGEKKVDEKDKEIKKDSEKDITEGKVEEVKAKNELTELAVSDENPVDVVEDIKKDDDVLSKTIKKEGEQMTNKFVGKTVESSEEYNENINEIDEKEKIKELKNDPKTTINNSEVDEITNESQGSQFSKVVSNYSKELTELSNTNVSLITKEESTTVNYDKVKDLAGTLKKLEEALKQDKEALKQKVDENNIDINNEQVSKNEEILEGYYEKLIELWEKASGYGENYGENLNKNVDNIKSSFTNSECVKKLVKDITGEEYWKTNKEQFVKQLKFSNKDEKNEGYLAAVVYVAYGKEMLKKFNVAVQEGSDALKNAVKSFVETENKKLKIADTSINAAIDENDNLEYVKFSDLF